MENQVRVLRDGCHWLCQCFVRYQRSSVPIGNPSIIGSPGSCCRGGSSKYQLALDHFQSTALFTNPRRTGVIWMYSPAASMTAAVVSFRSYPGPSCQNRKQLFSGHSCTVSRSTKGDFNSVERCFTRFEKGCLMLAAY